MPEIIPFLLYLESYLSATWAVSQTGLHIISKMRHDAALYLPYRGPKPARDATPRYGDKLNYAQLPAQYLVSTTVEDDYRIETYQMSAYHKDYPDCLNVSCLSKRNSPPHDADMSSCLAPT